MAIIDKEVWKPVVHLRGQDLKKYLVSSHGRLASYKDNINDKFILKLHSNGGFQTIKISVDGKGTALFAHHAVGHTFLKKKNPKCISLIHLDYDKANNVISNLKWVTKADQIEHNKKNPVVIESTARKVYTGETARKLNEKKVIALKKEIWNPKRKLTFKQLAEKYGIAEMNLYRIKNGEMWFHVHIDEEPIFPRYKQQLINIAYHAKISEKKQALKDKKAKVLLAKRKANLEKKEKLKLQKLAVYKAFVEKRQTQLLKDKALKVEKAKQVAIARTAAKLKKEKAIKLAKEKSKLVKKIAEIQKLKSVKIEKARLQKEKKTALKKSKGEKLAKLNSKKTKKEIAVKPSKKKQKKEKSSIKTKAKKSNKKKK